MKNFLLEKILKYNFITSCIITSCVLYFFHSGIVTFFSNDKSNVLNMLISLSGTLFGFVLTFLSIFLVFKTDEKYKSSADNETKPLIMLVNNKSFNEVYYLFIKSSYSLGLLLIMSLIYFFVPVDINYILNNFIVYSIVEVIVLCILRMFLSLYVFNGLIKILIVDKK